MKQKIKKELINKHKNEMPVEINNEPIRVKLKSGLIIDEYKTKSVNNNFQLDRNINIDSNLLKCLKINMVLNSNQETIIKKWMESYTKMYNKALHYIRTKIRLFQILNKENVKNMTNDNKKLITFYTLRNSLKNEKDKINKENSINGITIPVHTLDKSIHQLCSNIKVSIANLKVGNINHFRMRYWKQTRPSQTIEMEKNCFDKNKNLCFKKLGIIKYTYNNKDYTLENIKHNVKINYNRITNKFTLLIPVGVKINETKNKNNVISIDPGLRTFMTGLSENKAVKIGVDVNKNIKKIIKKIKKIKESKKVQTKNKKKSEIKYENKITNLIDELHWKTINYLTNNYNNILLGDMSAKSIIRKNKLILSSEMKIACMRTRYYQFQQRLIYKCIVNNIQTKIVDESYTSKTCSICGNINEKLGANVVYDCDKCGLKMDRDINACRNIYIKQQLD